MSLDSLAPLLEGTAVKFYELRDNLMRMARLRVLRLVEVCGV